MGAARGNLGIAGRAIYSSFDNGDPLLCAIAKEQMANGANVLESATKLGIRGAILSTTFGLGMVSGPAVKLFTLRTTLGLSWTALTYSVYGVFENAIESKHIFNEADKASKAGDFELAKKLLNEGRARAIASGLSAVDVVFASLSSKETLEALRIEMGHLRTAILGTQVPKESFDPAVIDDGVGVMRNNL